MSESRWPSRWGSVTTSGVLCAALLVLAPLSGHAQTEGRLRLAAEDRTALIDTVCTKIEQIYPFEEIATRTRDGLLTRLRAGEYDSFDAPQELAARLTEDMESLSHDKHLDLYYDPTLAAELLARETTGDAQDGPNPSEVEDARWENFGFKQLRFLDGLVGYLDLRMFFAARHASSTAVAAMDFLARSNAVIIDLRLNGGGWDDMVTLLASYFVDVEEAEVLAVNRSTLDQSYFASVVSAWVPGKRLTGIPVYLLISPSTASAAEAFASILQHLSDEVVLVGQTTAGAENPVERIALGPDFVLKIPCWKKIYFGTRPGWEGQGLRPDIEVPTNRALETAHLHALQTLDARLTEERARDKIRWGLDGQRALVQPATVAPEVLQALVGRYGSGRLLLEGTELYLQFEDRPRHRLHAVSADYFVIAGRDDLRLRFLSEDGRPTAMERVYSDGYRALDPRH